jgi:hypothetical protein
LWRGVEEPVPSVAEGTSAVLIFPMLLGAFQPPSPMTGYCDTHWMVTGTSFAAAENVNVGAGHSKMQQVLGSRPQGKTVAGPLGPGLGGRKVPSGIGKISTAEVPSATLRTGSSTPRHKRCITRWIGEGAPLSDDDSVGELTERRPLCGSRGAPQIGCARDDNLVLKLDDFT